jgi:hypothetical protein
MVRLELSRHENFRQWEASMHAPFDKSGKNGNSVFEKWGTGFLVLPVLLAIALVAMAIIQPTPSNWIAENVEAEFTGHHLVPADAPTQNAPPAVQSRTVSAR